MNDRAKNFALLLSLGIGVLVVSWGLCLTAVLIYQTVSDINSQENSENG